MDYNQYLKKENETAFEHKKRLCIAKKNHEIDLDWVEIVEILGLDCSPEHLRKVAVGIWEYDNYLNGFDGVATTILSISDLHVPFQLPKELLSDYIGKIDILQLNGDKCDMKSISRFPKAYRLSPMEEIIEARQYLIELIEYLMPKKVIVTAGNHDVRFQNYLIKNLDTDILELMPRTPLELILVDGFNHFNKKEHTKIYYKALSKVFPEIEIVYCDNWYCQIGDAIFCHPMAYSSAMLKTAEKALYWFRNEGFEFKNLIMAHTHHSGFYTIGNTSIYEQGAFCDVSKMDYADGKLSNSQKEGFIILKQDANGTTLKDKTQLKVLN